MTIKKKGTTKKLRPNVDWGGLDATKEEREQFLKNRADYEKRLDELRKDPSLARKKLDLPHREVRKTTFGSVPITNEVSSLKKDISKEDMTRKLKRLQDYLISVNWKNSDAFAFRVNPHRFYMSIAKMDYSLENLKKISIEAGVSDLPKYIKKVEYGNTVEIWFQGANV